MRLRRSGGLQSSNERGDFFGWLRMISAATRIEMKAYLTLVSWPPNQVVRVT